MIDKGRRTMMVHVRRAGALREQHTPQIWLGALFVLTSVACGATERTPDSDEASGVGTKAVAPFRACTEATQTEVPFERAAADATGQAPLLRWSRTGECIDVSYDADVEHLLPALETALARYNAVECSTLCFESPRRVGPLASSQANRVLHLKAATEPQPLTVMANTVYEEATGQLLSTSLSVDANKEAPTLNVLLHELGHVVGLAHVEGVESVMLPYETDLTALSAHDEAAICAMYGSEPELCVDE